MTVGTAPAGGERLARYRRSRAAKVLRSLLPRDREGGIAWALVAFAVAFNAYFLLPEVRIAAPKLNDGVLHVLSLRRMIDAFRAGADPTDVWFAPVTTGYPLFHHYQHLPFVIPALVSLALPNVGVVTIFNATSYLLLCAFPVSVYWSMRRFGFPQIVSALSALTAPLLSTNGLFGFDDLSYVWLGYGMYTQLWGMVLLPPALACGYTTIREGRGYVWSVLLVSAVVLAHLVLGYIALVSLCAFLFLNPSSREVFKRSRRLALMLALVGLVTSYFLVGALSDNAYLNRSVFEAQSKYDAFGYEWTLRALFGGRLFDYGRFRSLTLLVLAGAAVCVWRWRDERYRIPAVIGGLWLLMYFGRPTWGVLIGLATLNITFYLHRLIAGVHLGGIMLMGIALGLPWTWAFARRDARYLLVPAAITALVLFPVFKERREYLNSNERYMQASNNAYLSEQGDLDALMAALRKQPPGRVYAGFRASWGAKYTVGEAPMAGFLNSAGFDMVGYLYFPFSVNSDVQALFDESRPEQYNLFNVRYVVAPASRTFPDFVKPIGTFGRHRLYQVQTSGYFDLVGSDVTFKGDESEIFDAASSWLASGLPAGKEHPAITFDGADGAKTLALSSAPSVLAQMSIDAGASRGSIVSERIDGDTYRASVDVARPSMLMLKSTFHPGWHATVDGAPVKTVMLMPSYVAVPVRAGPHNIVFEYRPPKSRLPLMALGAALLFVIGLVEWRGRELKRFAAASLPWLPGHADLAHEPRAAMSETPVAAPQPAHGPRALAWPSVAAWPATRALAAIVGAATLLRVALTPLYAYLPNNSLDEYAWERWMGAIRQHGVLDIFRTTGTDYVGYHWVLWLLTAVYRRLGDDYRERPVHPGQYGALATPLHLLLKAPPIAFDAALIVAVFAATSALTARRIPRGTSRALALAAAAVIAFHPAVVYESAVWAQIDAAIAAAMLASIVLVARRRPGWGAAVWALGFAIKPHPIIILPVLAVLALRVSGWRGLARAAGGATLVLALILGPWILHGDAHRIYSTYRVLFQSDLYSGRLSYAAWNLWWFWDVASHPLPRDAMFSAVPFLTYKRIGLSLSVAAALLALAYAWRRPNLRGALIASAYISFAFYLLPTSTHERYLFPFLALLLPVAVTERRWLWIYVPASATFALNLLVVAPPVHAWSGRWVESPFSLAAAAANVLLFAVMTAVLIDGALPKRRRRVAAWSAAALGWVAPAPGGSDVSPPVAPTEAGVSRLPVPAVRRPAHVHTGVLMAPRHALILLSATVLVTGWIWTWWPINQDFNHLHGWEHAQDAQLARMFSDGALERWFVPAAYPLYDAGGHYRLYTHYPPLQHLLIAPLVIFAPQGVEHAVLRIAGMVVSAVFLVALAAFAARLGGRRFAAWAVVFAAINAELIFFGAFPDQHNFPALFAVLGYWAYLGWRRNHSQVAFLGALASLAAAQLVWVGYASAVAPILVDLVRHDPEGRGIRRWPRVVGVAALPLAVFVAVFVHYQIIAPAVIDNAWASDFRTNLAARTHYALLITPHFYRTLLSETLRFAGPVGLVAGALYALGGIAQAIRTRGAPKLTWQSEFIAGTLGLIAIAFVFPKNTLDHEFTYFQFVIPGSLIGALFVVRRGLVVQALAVVATVLAAFVGVQSLRSANNTPQREFQLGVGIRLATPPDAFVRVPLSGEDFYPMLLYYADRRLLFNVPPRFQTATHARFEVVFGQPRQPSNDGLVLLPGAGAVIVDHSPDQRPLLPFIGRSYEQGAWTILGARVTSSFDSYSLVEVAWRSARLTREPLALEIGQWAGRTWVPLATVRLRGGTVDSSSAELDRSFRDAYLVKPRSGGQLALRVLDTKSHSYPRDDLGSLDIGLEN